MLLTSRTAGLDSQAEMALMFASRAQLIAEVIRPALEAGKWVLCDRFTDSTEAYQGGGRRLGAGPCWSCIGLCGEVWPDLTILMDSDVSSSVPGRAGATKPPSTMRIASRKRSGILTRVHEASWR